MVGLTLVACAMVGSPLVGEAGAARTGTYRVEGVGYAITLYVTSPHQLTAFATLTSDHPSGCVANVFVSERAKISKKGRFSVVTPGSSFMKTLTGRFVGKEAAGTLRFIDPPPGTSCDSGDIPFAVKRR